MRIMVPNDSVLSFQLLFGYIGLFNAISLLPVLLILRATTPSVFAGFTPTVFGFIIMNGKESIQPLPRSTVWVCMRDQHIAELTAGSTRALHSSRH